MYFLIAMFCTTADTNLIYLIPDTTDCLVWSNYQLNKDALSDKFTLFNCVSSSMTCMVTNIHTNRHTAFLKNFNTTHQFLDKTILEKTILEKTILDKTILDNMILDKTILTRQFQKNQFETFKELHNVSHTYKEILRLFKNIKIFKTF